MAKTEVYSWRVAPEVKMALESEARLEGTTLAEILDHLAQDWLAARNRRGDRNGEQARLQAAVKKTLGTIAGRDPQRSETARAALRARLRSRYAR